jgi:hypothetical protein
MTDLVTSPAERTVRVDLESARFCAGVDAGRWRLIFLEWPHALIAVAAAPRDGAPDEFVLRFDLSGYPQPGPTAGLWDMSTNASLAVARRPKGEWASQVFRADWEGSRALYAPWDRVALDSHQNWIREHPLYAWHARRDLTFYLTNVWEVLNDDAYLGI